MPADFKTIEATSDAGVLTIMLNRPDCLNALDQQMTIELGATLHMAQRDSKIRAVLITGAGRAFCSGFDLGLLRENYTKSGKEGPQPAGFGPLLRQQYHPLIMRLRTLEKPVVAAVNGAAAGGGASLAFACDLRVCAKNAYFKMAFVNIGLVPDMGATLTLLQHVGYARAAELCFLGEKLSAEEALACGLANSIVDDAHLDVTASGLATKLAAMPTRAIGLTKRALRRAWNATLDDQLEYETYLQETASRTGDHIEGVRAFLAKRKPKFTGA